MRMNEIKAWEAKCRIEFAWAQQDYKLAAEENALFEYLAIEEMTPYGPGTQARWDNLCSRFGYVELLDAGERLVLKGRCGMYHGALYTFQNAA